MKNRVCKIAVILLLLLFCFITGRQTAKVVNFVSAGTEDKGRDWGLSFNHDGEKPVGNEREEELKKNNAYYIGDEDKIYLTFDTGYENGNMGKILDALKKHNVCATFFVVGNFIEDNKELVKRMSDEGHNIGNHSFSHPDMSSYDLLKFKGEINKLEDKYREVTGKEMIKLYRPPMGRYSHNSLEHAKNLGYKTIFWSLAYVDWYDDKQPDPSQAIDKLTKRIHPGAIVLLHSTSKTNAEILDELLTKWEEMGYNFGDLKELN